MALFDNVVQFRMVRSLMREALIAHVAKELVAVELEGDVSRRPTTKRIDELSEMAFRIVNNARRAEESLRFLPQNDFENS